MEKGEKVKIENKEVDDYYKFRKKRVMLFCGVGPGRRWKMARRLWWWGPGADSKGDASAES